MRLSPLPLLLVLAASAVAQPASRPAMVVGTLQSRVDRVPQVRQAGITLATVSVSWDRFEPQRGKIDQAYVDAVRGEIDAFRKAGQLVQIDLGMQYPPDWVRDLPDSRYVNQYGEAYIDERPGANIVNGVFSAAVRQRQGEYVAAVFGKLGRDFHAVRLGWNYYGELGYPAAKFKERSNCYWGFDRIAQGEVRGLPAGVKPCPVPGWKPGVATPRMEAAAAFANWYVDSLAAYQQWQIATVRRHYAGRLVVLLGSWGLRPGMRAAEVEQHLGREGQTELSLGYDFGRLIKAIDDPQVAVCTTWIDSDPSFGDEDADDPRRWSPVHYLSTVLDGRNIELWAENTGRADAAAMRLSVERVRRYGVSTLVWAFEPDLFDGQHATLAELAGQLKR